MYMYILNLIEPFFKPARAVSWKLSSYSTKPDQYKTHQLNKYNIYKFYHFPMSIKLVDYKDE